MNLGILMPQAVDPASGRRDGDFTSRLVLIERCHGDAAPDSDSDSEPTLESPSL